jgi:hypothetical protein
MIKILNGIPVLCDEINNVKHGDTNKLQELLERGQTLGVLINTHQFRSIGKTYSLIEYARKNNSIVVIPNKLVLQYFINQYHYNNIVEVSCISIMGNNNGYVLDEGINIQAFKKMYPNAKILTGWFDSIANKEVETFEEQVIYNLKNEIELLTSKIKITRENHDFGTYKNLILAYKEVLGLYKEMAEPKKTC